MDLTTTGQIIPLLAPIPSYIPAPSDDDVYEDDAEYLEAFEANEPVLNLLILMLRKVSRVMIQSY